MEVESSQNARSLGHCVTDNHGIKDRHLILGMWLTFLSLVDVSIGSLEQAPFNQNRLPFMAPHSFNVFCPSRVHLVAGSIFMVEVLMWWAL